MYASNKKMRRENVKTEKRVTREETKEFLDKANNAYESYGKFMLPVGKCAKCGGMLFIYTASLFENMMNVYCSDCNIVEDARFPKGGDMFIADTDELGIQKDATPAQIVIALQKKEGTLKDTKLTDGEIDTMVQTLPISLAVNLTEERRAAMEM